MGAARGRVGERLRPVRRPGRDHAAALGVRLPAGNQRRARGRDGAGGPNPATHRDQAPASVGRSGGGAARQRSAAGPTARPGALHRHPGGTPTTLPRDPRHRRPGIDRAASPTRSSRRSRHPQRGSQNDRPRRRHRTRQSRRGSTCCGRARFPRLDSADLPTALEELTAAWSAGSGTEATFRTVGEARPHGNNSTLLRVCQEALSNVARHAHASRVAVRLSYLPDSITLDVEDDGTGMDPVRTRTGHGISGMRSRLATIGGQLTLATTEGGGCTLRAAVPQ